MGRGSLFFLGLFCGLLGYGFVDFFGKHLILRAKLSSKSAKALYTLGQLYARRGEMTGLTASEASIVSLGFQDWAGNEQSWVDFESNRHQLKSFLEEKRSKEREAAKAEGQEYLNKFLKSGGRHSLSGLAYRIIVAGSEKKPSLKDWVQVSYRGTLVNGNLVDASGSMDGPSKGKINLPMNGIIAGWTEGLQLIGEGGEIELVVPSELGYGEAGTVGSPTAVPAGATLLFRIQLHRGCPKNHV